MEAYQYIENGYNRISRTLLTGAWIAIFFFSAISVARADITSPSQPSLHTWHAQNDPLPVHVGFFAFNDDGDSNFKKKYKHWQKLTPAEKQKLRRRMKQYKKMPPQERRRYQKKLQQWQNLTPEERADIQKNLDRWSQLSPQEKEAVLRKFKHR